MGSNRGYPNGTVDRPLNGIGIPFVQLLEPGTHALYM